MDTTGRVKETSRQLIEKAVSPKTFARYEKFYKEQEPTRLLKTAQKHAKDAGKKAEKVKAEVKKELKQRKRKRELKDDAKRRRN